MITLKDLIKSRYEAQKEFLNIAAYYLLEKDERLRKIFELDLKEARINYQYYTWLIKQINK